MLAAAQRLRRSSDFAAAIRGGHRAGRGTLVVHLTDSGSAESADWGRFRQAPSARQPRAGFVVSKAVGGAVTRNTIRRRLRHLVRDRITALPPGTVLVVRALPAAASAPYARLGSDLDGALAAARARNARGRRHD